MTTYRKAIGLATAAALASVSLAACGGGGSGGSSSNTLNYISFRPAEHFDPQRVYIGRDISNLGRLAYRSLVTNPVTTDAKKANELVPDLATDTGTSSNGGKKWTFTLKDGVKWQDGKDITCADLKYGISRTFATSVITGGPNYTLGYLDIPTKTVKGQEVSVYEGPYTNKGSQYFDKAVTCEGKTITYNFKKPFPDFPIAIAALRAFDPYRKDQDKGDKSNFSVFSSGPYKLQGSWRTGKGGTFVKNKEWDASTDTVRKQNVDKVVFTEGLKDEIIAQRLIADRGSDQTAITDRSLLPAFYNKITGSVAKRATLKDSPYVFYLLPNFNRVKNLKVRQAIQFSTDAQGWIDAQGGDKAYKPVKSIIADTLVGAEPNPSFSSSSMDVTKAKALLKSSGEKQPYPLTYTYNSSPTADKAAAALKAGWQSAGFKVTLDPLADTYYDVINKKDSKSDVVVAGWGADWPTIATVLPPLFDGRLNLQGSDTNGNDYGNYSSKTVNALFDKAGQESSVDAAAKDYTAADAQLGKDVAYIPLGVQEFYLLRGSKIGTYVQNPATSMFPDLGDISVKK